PYGFTPAVWPKNDRWNRSASDRAGMGWNSTCVWCALVARSRSAGSASQRSLAVFARIEMRPGDQCHRHLHIAQHRAGAVPVLGILRGHLDDADVRVVRTVPPDFCRNRPQFLDLGAIIADLGRSGDGDVFLSAGVGKGEADLRKLADLV